MTEYSINISLLWMVNKIPWVNTLEGVIFFLSQWPDSCPVTTRGYIPTGTVIMLTIQLHAVLKVTREWNFTSTPTDVIPDFVGTTNFTFFIFKNFVYKWDELTD